MSFLSPALFTFLIPLAALPLVLHLLNKGFPRQVAFPSISLIRETMARRSSLHRWRHLILLLLRTLVLLLLVLAFLQPVLHRFQSLPAGKGGRQVLIVLDNSLSMQNRGDGASAQARAVHEASKLLDSLGAEDSANILLLNSKMEACFPTFSRDTNEAIRFLQKLKPGFGRADVNLATSTAARLLHKGGGQQEIYYLSDFERKKWSDASFSALPTSVRIFFVDVGATKRGNRVIIDARPAETQILAGETIQLQVRLGNFSPETFHGLLQVTLDKQRSQDQEITLGPWSEEKVNVPVPAGGPGIHFCELQLPPDDLVSDDHFFLTLAVQDKEEVLIVSDAPQKDTGSAFFLKTALNPYEHEAGSLLPRIIASTELSATRMAGVQKIYFTQVNQLSPEASEATAQFIFQGGGLLYFLDGTAEKENLQALETRFGPNTLPLRLARRSVSSNINTDAQQVVRGDFKSPFLKIFDGPSRQNLSLLEFYDYYQAGATGAGRTLLEYGDGSPALASLTYGKGTLLFLNFSPSELASNLARQRIFPAWMQEMSRAISTAEPPPSSYSVDESRRIEIWRREMGLDLLGPRGARVVTRMEVAGERCHLDFTPEQPGYYTLGSPQPLYALAINPATDQSDLRPMEVAVLRSQFSENHQAQQVSGGDDYEELAHGRPIFYWFVWAGLALLMVESLFHVLAFRSPS